MFNIMEQSGSSKEAGATRTRRSAIGLGLAGLVPFWGFAIAAALMDDPAWRAVALDGALFWGALIFAFLTGARWAWILASEAPSIGRLAVAGFLPALSLAALFLTPSWGLAGLIAAYGLFLGFELAPRARQEAPRWYPPVRIGLSLAAILAMVLAWSVA